MICNNIINNNMTYDNNNNNDNNNNITISVYKYITYRNNYNILL